MGSVDVIREVGRATFEALDSGALFILVGLLGAGLLHEFVSTERIVALLGRRNWRSILGATLLGAPLPLCSCGALPAAILLRRKGASREATMAFLISAPETGIDSIALTYGLLGPFMAVVRPIAGVATALAAGFASLLLPDPEEAKHADGTTGHDEHCLHAPEDSPPPAVPLKARLQRAIDYGFGSLLDDMAFWLLMAFGVTGLIQGLLPADFFSTYLPPGLPAMFVMALIGIPVYVCASGSTPIAMAMMARGLDPGSALVFMLTGPATNASSLAVVARLFGRRFVAVYLGSVLAVAVLFGLIVNQFAGTALFSGSLPAVGSDEGAFAFIRSLSSAVLLLLVGGSLRRTGLRPGFLEARDHFRAALAFIRAGLRRPEVPAILPRLAAALVLLFVGSSSIVQVNPGEMCAVQVFGRPTASLQPGLHLVAPWPFAVKTRLAASPIRSVAIGFLPVRVGETDRPLDDEPTTPPGGYPPVVRGFDPSQSPRIAEGSQFVTGDENVISIAAVIQYRIADASRYLFGSDRPESLLRAVGREKLLGRLARLPIDEVYASARASTEASVLGDLRASSLVEAAGLDIVAVRLLYVHAPDAVHAAFRDVASAVEDGTTSRNKALVDQEGIVRLASAEAFQATARAGAEADERIQKARGDADLFTSMARVGRSARSATELRLRIESFERALAGKRKIIKPSAREAPGLELWISPAGVVQSNPTGPEQEEER